MEVIPFEPPGLDHGIENSAVACPVGASVSEGDFSGDHRRADSAFGEVVVKGPRIGSGKTVAGEASCG